LVAWSRAEFEDFALSGAEKGGDTGGVFKGDKAVGIYDEEVCYGGVSNPLGMYK